MVNKSNKKKKTENKIKKLLTELKEAFVYFQDFVNNSLLEINFELKKDVDK